MNRTKRVPPGDQGNPTRGRAAKEGSIAIMALAATLALLTVGCKASSDSDSASRRAIAAGGAQPDCGPAGENATQARLVAELNNTKAQLAARYASPDARMLEAEIDAMLRERVSKSGNIWGLDPSWNSTTYDEIAQDYLKRRRAGEEPAATYLGNVLDNLAAPLRFNERLLRQATSEGITGQAEIAAYERDLTEAFDSWKGRIRPRMAFERAKVILDEKLAGKK